MGSISSRLKKQRFKKAAPYTPVPVLAKCLIVFLVFSMIFFAGTYSYWANDWYGKGTYHFANDPFTNVWNGQVGNYTHNAAPAFNSAVTGTVGFGTSLSPSASTGGPTTGTDTGHLSVTANQGGGIVAWVYSQAPQSYFINDSVQNSGPGSLFSWFGSSAANNHVGRLGICYVATESGSLVGTSFLIKNPGGSAAGTIQGEFYSTTGSQFSNTGGFGAVPGNDCASNSALLATSANTVTMASLSTVTPTFVIFNFNTTVVKGNEYIAVALMTFTNVGSASLQFEQAAGSWRGVVGQGPYCASLFQTPPPALYTNPVPACNYSSIDNAGTSTQGALNNPANDNDQFPCSAPLPNGCIWFNPSVQTTVSNPLCANQCFSVSDSNGDSYNFLGCVTMSSIKECAFDALASASVTWIDVTASTAQYYSVLAVSYNNVYRFGQSWTNSTSCLGTCTSVTLESPSQNLVSSQFIVGGYQVYQPDPGGWDSSLTTVTGTQRAVDGNIAGVGAGCDGYAPCGGNFVYQISSAQLYCSPGPSCTPGQSNLTPSCTSGTGLCISGLQVSGIWVQILDNSCPSGWQCFLSSAEFNGNGRFDGTVDLNPNAASASVFLSNDSYTLATAVGKPLSFIEDVAGGTKSQPFGWYLTSNGTLPGNPAYNPLNDPNVYLAVVAYPLANAGTPTLANGTFVYYTYMRHANERQGLLAAGGGISNPYPVCSPNADVYICGRTGTTQGVMSLLLNFTGGTEGGGGVNNCVPDFVHNDAPCGSSYMCLSSSAAIGVTSCTVAGDFNTGQTTFLLGGTGQVNFTRIFPWLDIQSQKFHTGFWASQGQDKTTIPTRKWVSGDPGCTGGNTVNCIFNNFHIVFPNSGSCTIVNGGTAPNVPCNTQDTSFIGWLGGLFNTGLNFVSTTFAPIVNPFLQLGNSLLGSFVAGVSQAFVYLASGFQVLLNDLGTLWGNPHFGDQVLQLFQNVIKVFTVLLTGIVTFQLWVFNFFFVVVPFLLTTFITVVAAVANSVLVIIIALIPLIVAFGGVINMPLQSVFFFDYVFGISAVFFNGVNGFMAWIRFNIWLWTLGFKVFDYGMSKILWTVRSLKQLIPVVG